MLVNPFTATGRASLQTVADSNLLCETFGISGETIPDPNNRYRLWTVQALYAPVSWRAVGGVRAKLADQKGFVTFCNQRDLEVLLDIVSPGDYCPWLDKNYVAPDDDEWLGLCSDEQDLIDDLYDREIEARDLFPSGSMLPPGLSLGRRIHDGRNNDFVEEMTLLWDGYRGAGGGPDMRYETVINRWASVERTPQIDRVNLWSRI